MSAPPFSHDELRGLLNYDAEAGVFTWNRSRKKCRPGTIAGNRDNDGYIRITVLGKSYKAQRLAWFHVYGEWPDTLIDHDNRIRDDNRINNLRKATRSQNQWNRAKDCRNKSGFFGVSIHKKTGKWRATIVVNYRQKFLGLFDSPEDASHAYMEAKERLHVLEPVGDGKAVERA